MNDRTRRRANARPDDGSFGLRTPPAALVFTKSIASNSADDPANGRPNDAVLFVDDGSGGSPQTGSDEGTLGLWSPISPGLGLKVVAGGQGER